jgi:hypothetical protein
METSPQLLSEEAVAEAKRRRIEAMHLQEIESNPLEPDEVAMFEMFERERWPHERRLAYILEKAGVEPLMPAAE